MSPLNWPFGGWPADSTVIIVAATAAVTFVAFHYGAPARAWQRWLGDDADGQAHAVYAQRLAGAVLLGVVPALIAAAALPFSVFDLGLGPGDPLRGGLALAGILVLSLPAVILASRGPDFADDYPLIRAVGWSHRRRLANAGT
ncbi:MAG: hypothetical protein KC620_25055, partial [Myxococcales bacterium]|nr:hypothetical protein [Myxococcales bacterium]